ncbi:MAG TPA: 16S rRNA (guanine(527)-N(7))-methyltransferase RsmG [Blastocatellia bacterium]|nr:16S rRNA (guanine(527)-N(7))-methyltransferase RsmG [Blastocatellia bacterium]
MSRDHTTTFKSDLETAISSFGIEALTEEQTNRLVRHYSMLCRWNQRLNLTRITEPREAARLHYAESLFAARFIAGARTLLDIGSGAGFPAIPLAVARPDVQVTALEANQKKSLFLKEAKDELGLANLKVVTARLEDFDWGRHELLTSRALDRAEAILPSIIEGLSAKQRLMLYCAPDLFAKLEGQVNYNIETHPIPQSEARIVAIFSRE